MTTSFPVHRFSDIQQRPSDFKLLERIPFTCDLSRNRFALTESLVGDEIKLVILDTETTGFDASAEKIIELGMVSVLYSPSLMKITMVSDVVSMYEDPGKPIPEVITGITGITDDMVAGQTFDKDRVAEFLRDDPLVIAHHAGFDRPFFEKRFPEYANLRWACSIKGVDWKALGFESNKLEYILLRSGYFYEGHRASIDCLAMAWLFFVNENALISVLASAAKKTFIVRAFGAPFDVKDSLKARDYQWDDGTGAFNKHWHCEIADTQLEEERDFLDQLYRGAEIAHFEPVNARTRFK